MHGWNDKGMSMLESHQREAFERAEAIEFRLSGTGHTAKVRIDEHGNVLADIDGETHVFGYIGPLTAPVRALAANTDGK